MAWPGQLVIWKCGCRRSYGVRGPVLHRVRTKRDTDVGSIGAQRRTSAPASGASILRKLEVTRKATAFGSLWKTSTCHSYVAPQWNHYDCREHGLWPTLRNLKTGFEIGASVSRQMNAPCAGWRRPEPNHTDEDIREHNARLIAEVARLTEAVEARDTFLVVAAHELRNPMTPIIGRIQVLARAVRRPDFQVERLVQGLDEIEWLIARYLKRANVLLDVSRITSGKLALDRLPVDVCAIAREIIENFRPLKQNAGSDLTLELPGEPVVVSVTAWRSRKSSTTSFRTRSNMGPIRRFRCEWASMRSSTAPSFVCRTADREFLPTIRLESSSASSAPSSRANT